MPNATRKAISQALAGGDPEGAYRLVMQMLDGPVDYTSAVWAHKQLAKILAQHDPAYARTCRVALLGSFTTSQMVPLLDLELRRADIEPEIYEAPFDQIHQQILDPGSALHRFEPDVVLIAVTDRDAHLPGFSDQPDERVDAEVARWQTLWQTCRRHTPCQIVQHNVVVPRENTFGHLATSIRGARATMLRRLNLMLGEAAPDGVTLLDVDHIAALYGKDRWFDDKFWYLAKQGVALEALPVLARHQAGVVRGVLGLSKKCLVLDLDNTLWGGVIGEDGLEGIQLGEGPVGEAMVDLQRYVLELKQRGIVLAVCSKNNEADAREPFEKHPAMVLGLDDIAVFKANWQPKPDNLVAIADELNIGIDSLVFVDDNPAERDIVRQNCPAVTVVEMPEDPTRYRAVLDATRLFEAVSFSAEDRKRADMYRVEAQRRELVASCTNIEDFCRSLEMTAAIGPVRSADLARVTQLVNKSNQWNLTTRRYTQAQIEVLVADDACYPYALKLKDRYGDYGLVAVAIGKRDGTCVEVDTWLMSCRVIGRTAERLMMAHLTQWALTQGCTTVRGTYIPAKKNALVRDVYAQMGFSKIDEADDGTTRWEYDLSAGAITNDLIAVAASAA